MKVLTILSTVFLALAVNAAVVRDTTNVLAVQDCEDRCRHDQEDCLRRIDDHYDHRDRPHREHERERECEDNYSSCSRGCRGRDRDRDHDRDHDRGYDRDRDHRHH